MDLVHRTAISSPPISIARDLWRLGEPALAERARHLTPAQAAVIGVRAAELYASGEAARLWPDGPAGDVPAVLLAAVEHLEGAARPCARSERLPERDLPHELHVDEEDRLEAMLLVDRELERRGYRHG